MVAQDAPLLINADDEHGQQLLDQHQIAFAYGFDTRQEMNSYMIIMGPSYSDPTQLIEIAISVSRCRR